MVERRKKYGWLVLFSLFFWSLFVAMIVFVDPENLADIPFTGLYAVPAMLGFICLFLLFTIVCAMTISGLLWATCSLVFLYLRVIGIKGWWNGLLLLGIAICGQLYLSLRKRGLKTETKEM